MYSWRHNWVLAILAEPTETQCRVANEQPTQDPNPCICFHQEGEAPPRQVSKQHGQNCLTAARDWKMGADHKQWDFTGDDICMMFQVCERDRVVLTSCGSSLQMYTWLHKWVLAILAELTETQCRVANERPTQIPEPMPQFSPRKRGLTSTSQHTTWAKFDENHLNNHTLLVFRGVVDLLGKTIYPSAYEYMSITCRLNTGLVLSGGPGY